jgi:hypothetical protein
MTHCRMATTRASLSLVGRKRALKAQDLFCDVACPNSSGSPGKPLRWRREGRWVGRMHMRMCKLGHPSSITWAARTHGAPPPPPHPSLQLGGWVKAPPVFKLQLN